jgi:Leucine-rich repeat (LRR) protein
MKQMFCILFLVQVCIFARSEKINYRINNHSGVAEYNQTVVKSDEDGVLITVLQKLPSLRKGMLEMTALVDILLLENLGLLEIEPGAFDNQNIQKLILADNNLTTIRTGTFKNLPLQYLTLFGNQIESIEANGISDMPELRSIDLSFNKIVQIDAGSIVNTPKLDLFQAMFNNLKKLDEKALHFMRRNSSIHLDHNEIDEIHPLAFRNLRMEYLSLEHNHLKDVPEELWSEDAVDFVNLENNQLQKLSETLFRCKNLKGVFLQDNPLSCEAQRRLNGSDFEFIAMYDLEESC